MGLGLNINPPQEPTPAPPEKDSNYPKIFDEGAFTVDKHAFLECYQSYDKEGHPIVFSPTEEACIIWSRVHLMEAQEKGSSGVEARIVGDARIGVDL